MVSLPDDLAKSCLQLILDGKHDYPARHVFTIAESLSAAIEAAKVQPPPDGADEPLADLDELPTE